MDLEQRSDVDPEPLVGLAWLWRLRWAALLGQMAMLALASLGLGVELEWLNLALAACAFVLSNLVLGRWVARRSASHQRIAGVLIFDVLLLTAVLSWSGGASNPFSALYVVHVAIAALMLGPVWTLGMVLLTSLCFGSLFLFLSGNAGHHAAHGASALHLRGMWAAYVLSASFVGYFVTRVASALRQREQQMQALRRYAASIERVASLSTMAAGAAHELGTPLASIAVSASELAEALGQHTDWGNYAEEARQIRQEVSRCRAILDRLARGAGQLAGEGPAWIAVPELIERVQQDLGPADAALIEVESGLRHWRLHCPPAALAQTLSNLIRNGIDATRTTGSVARVQLRLFARGTRALWEVVDSGPGISPAVAERLGEPFFTTKSVGSGMGLGVYLVKTFAHQVGGSIDFEMPAGGGTVARLMLGEGSLDASQSE